MAFVDTSTGSGNGSAANGPSFWDQFGSGPEVINPGGNNVQPAPASYTGPFANDPNGPMNAYGEPKSLNIAAPNSNPGGDNVQSGNVGPTAGFDMSSPQGQAAYARYLATPQGIAAYNNAGSQANATLVPGVNSSGGAPAAPAGAAGSYASPADEIRAKYTQAYGHPPSDQDMQYWTEKWAGLQARGQELGDPNYASMRLMEGGPNYQGPHSVDYQRSNGGGGSGNGYTLGNPNDLTAQWDTPFNAPTGATEQNDPGYAFRLDQGLKSIERGASAKGTLLSGGVLKGLQRYAQDYASGEFGNVYNRAIGEYTMANNIFNTNQNNLFSRNYQLAQLGQAAAAGQAVQGGQAAQSGAGLITGSGNAQAAGTAAAGSAYGTAVGNIGQVAAGLQANNPPATSSTYNFGPVAPTGGSNGPSNGMDPSFWQ